TALRPRRRSHNPRKPIRRQLWLRLPLRLRHHHPMTTTNLSKVSLENKPGTETSVPPDKSSFTSQRGFRLIAVIGAAILLGALVVGFVPRLSQRKQAASDTNQLAIP